MNKEENIIHIYPTAEDHKTDGTPCWCEPEREEEENGWLVRHHQRQ